MTFSHTQVNGKPPVHIPPRHRLHPALEVKCINLHLLILYSIKISAQANDRLKALAVIVQCKMSMST